MDRVINPHSKVSVYYTQVQEKSRKDTLCPFNELERLELQEVHTLHRNHNASKTLLFTAPCTLCVVDQDPTRS